MANLFDTFVAYKFIKLLSTPFDKTDAYKLGIIDADGNILKKRKSLINSKDKKAYPSNVYTLVWNLKKVLMKIPIVKSRVGQFASALYLLKEETGCDYDALLEVFSRYTGINKQDLVLTEQGKATEMQNKKIVLEGHIKKSPIQDVEVNNWDTLDGETRLAIAESIYSNKTIAAKIASKSRNELDSRTFQKLSEARYGDAELVWDDMPEDERFDVAEIAFDASKAKKISKTAWKKVSSSDKKKLIKTMEDETDGLVTIAEARYGDAELVWDDMPEDERFDVAEIAFGTSKGKKISKMKWDKVSPADKKKVIKTMEDETDGLVTIAEAEGTKQEEIDKNYMQTIFVESMVDHGAMDRRDARVFIKMVELAYEGSYKEAYKLTVSNDLIQLVFNFLEESRIEGAPESFWLKMHGGNEQEGEKLLKDAKKMGYVVRSGKRLEGVSEAKGKESAKDHWRRISRKGVVGVPIDRDRFPNREKEGLEGPYRSKKSGLIYYYDRKEGKYYDPQSDMYLQVSDVMEARLTSKKVAPKRNKNKPAGMLGVRADSPDWKSATIAIPVKTFDGDGAETIFRKGDMIDYHKFDSQRVVGAKDRTDPMTYFYLAKTRIAESVDLEEGKMKELHMHIEDGKTAEEIAKIMKIDVKAIKALMKDFEESVNEAMIGVSGYRLVSLPAAYRFSFGGDAKKFVEGIKTNYSRDVVAATIDKGGRLVHVEYTDPDKKIEKEVRRRVEKTARHYKAQIVAEERATWSLDELGFQPEKKSESLAEAWSAETIDDAAKSKYGITITPKMMRAAKKEYWHMTTTKDRGDRYRVQLQIKGGDPTNISGTADEVAAKVNDELNLKEATNIMEVDLRDLATKGMGTLTAKQARQTVGKDQQYFSQDGGKKLNGVIVKVTADEYTIQDSRTKKRHTFKVYDEKQAKVLVSEAADDRTVIAKALKKWAKPYVTGTISVKSGKGKFPYVQLTARDGEIDNKLRKMVMDKAFPKAKNVGNMDDISYGNVTKSYIAIGAGDWARVMGLEEDMPATNTSGVAGTGSDPVVGVPTSKKKKKKATTRTKSMTEMNSLPKKYDLVSEYKGVKVFQISAEEFEATANRRKYQRWTESDAFIAVKRYSHKNPGKPVIIQNENTGEMKLVRRRMNDGRLRHNRK